MCGKDIRTTQPPALSWVAVTVALPLVVGIAIYLVWRPPDIVAFDWLVALGLSEALHAARDMIGPAPTSVPRMVLFSLPTGLWVFAFASALWLVWSGNGRRERFAWLAVPVVVALGAEIGQLVGFVPGHFDLTDLIVIIVSLAVATALWWPRDGGEEVTAS